MIKKYDQVLAIKKLDSELESAVLLHKAFRLSMLNDYEEATRILNRIIDDFPDTEATRERRRPGTIEEDLMRSWENSKKLSVTTPGLFSSMRAPFGQGRPTAAN